MHRGSRRRRHGGVWVAVLVLLAGFGALRLRFLPVTVSGHSMLPTLKNGDWAWIDRRAYLQHPPQRHDIVLAHWQGELIVKRVVGLPGEEVAVIDGEVWVDGQVSSIPHARLPGNLDLQPGWLPPGRFAVLGDNRSLAEFQSVHAVLRQDQVVGKVVWVIPWGGWRDAN
ncbi:MAG: signal peptidase I [Verrucomicrobiales bacterium]|nr:signal peptidase I [Verrucomicrobiales bacterium]